MNISIQNLGEVLRDLAGPGHCSSPAGGRGSAENRAKSLWRGKLGPKFAKNGKLCPKMCKKVKKSAENCKKVQKFAKIHLKSAKSSENPAENRTDFYRKWFRRKALRASLFEGVFVDGFVSFSRFSVEFAFSWTSRKAWFY